jgi:hypothetical protein
MTILKNNGYSEVFYFNYAADCQPVQILGTIIEKRRVNISWAEAGAPVKIHITRDEEFCPHNI